LQIVLHAQLRGNEDPSPATAGCGEVFLASTMKAASAASAPEIKSIPHPFHGLNWTARVQIAQIRIIAIIDHLRRWPPEPGLPGCGKLDNSQIPRSRGY
jgi:hypothetical protein